MKNALPNVKVVYHYGDEINRDTFSIQIRAKLMVSGIYKSQYPTKNRGTKQKHPLEKILLIY